MSLVSAPSMVKMISPVSPTVHRSPAGKSLSPVSASLPPAPEKETAFRYHYPPKSPHSRPQPAGWNQTPPSQPLGGQNVSAPVWQCGLKPCPLPLHRRFRSYKWEQALSSRIGVYHRHPIFYPKGSGKMIIGLLQNTQHLALL